MWMKEMGDEGGERWRRGSERWGNGRRGDVRGRNKK